MTVTLVAPENDYSSLSSSHPLDPSLRVAVVVPVYNRVSLLRRTLAGLATQTYPSELVQVIVADDGSEEDVAAVADDFDISYVRRDHDGYGAGQARNLGAETAEGADVLVFLDADCIPDPETISLHAHWHHLADNLVVVGSRHHFDASAITAEGISNEALLVRTAVFGTGRSEAEDWASDDYRRILHRRTWRLRRGDEAFRSLVSSNFSVRRAEFMSAGGFSEDFRRWGGEDTELGWRLWNEGLYFVDEPRAAIYHQIQEDTGSGDWRGEGRRANDGLLQSKIPHRFYRTPAPTINERPKVSVVITSSSDDRLEELSDQVLSQNLDDVEIFFVGDSPDLQGFVERRSGDPRFGLAESPAEAVKISSGEFIALVNGSTALDHRLLSRSVRALEKRPDQGWVRAAYGIPTSKGLDVYRRMEDIASLDAAWGKELPAFGLARRRDLMKTLRGGANLSEAWAWVAANLDSTTHRTPLVFLPARSPSDPAPMSLWPPRSLRSIVVSDLKTGGITALLAPIRAVATRLTKTPYHPTPVGPDEARPSTTARPTIRYVGWTGRSNLGDEAMLDAVAGLFPGTDVVTSGETADVLMLGGGTLINRGYLRHLRPLDSPRIERVAFGPGVAHPDYWGEPKEDSRDWVGFLESCLYVGVRGPRSADLLSSWGLKDVEVVGDPALSLRAPSGVEVVEGRIVVCPAWARGLLWGGSDEIVIEAFAGLVQHLRGQGHDVWVLSAFPGDDRHIIDMMRKASAPELPYLAAHDEPMTAMELMASAELVVAQRLHAAVLAAAAGTVPVMVEYRPKLRDFAESVDLSDLVTRTDEIVGSSLQELTDHALANRVELASRMIARVEDLRAKQARAAANIIAALE